MYVILGDSHARSFSYNDCFFPIFVCSGKNMQLKTEKETDNTISLLKIGLKNVIGSPNVLVLLGESTIRASIESQTKGFDENVLYRNLVQVYDSLIENGVAVKMLPPIPRGDKKYAKAWMKFRLCIEGDFRWIYDAFDTIVTDNGELNECCTGDHIHGNHKVADALSRRLRLNGVSRDKFSLEIRYKGYSGGVLWGGVPMGSLVYNSTTSRNWKEVNAYSDGVYAIANMMLMYSKTFGHFIKKTIFINELSGKEGALELLIGLDRKNREYSEFNQLLDGFIGCGLAHKERDVFLLQRIFSSDLVCDEKNGDKIITYAPAYSMEGGNVIRVLGASICLENFFGFELIYLKLFARIYNLKNQFSNVKVTLKNFMLGK
jgi:hypothetical protein